jgi:hypothetical protein
LCQYCPYLREDTERGLCHLSTEGRISFRKPNPASRPVFIYWDRSQHSQVLSNARAYSILSPSVLVAAAVSTIAGVSAITVTYRDSDSDEEEAVYTHDIDPEEVEVNAREVRLKADSKWKTPKAILKRKAKTERSLPRPRTLQARK